MIFSYFQFFTQRTPTAKYDLHLNFAREVLSFLQYSNNKNNIHINIKGEQKNDNPLAECQLLRQKLIFVLEFSQSVEEIF
jgi:hypothetical protein